MTETKYYTVTVELPEQYDVDVYMARVEYYNDYEQHLHFLKRDENGALGFLLVKRCKPGSYDFFDLLHEMSDIFDDGKIDVCSLKTLDIDSEQMRHIQTVRRLMLVQNSCKVQNRWNVRSADEIIAGSKSMIGFEAFKAGLCAMRRYCENSPRHTGNYNTVFVNDSSLDAARFTEFYFDLLCAEGIILDSRMAEGDLSDALAEGPDTTKLFMIFEEWGYEAETAMLRVTSRSEAFLRIAERKCVFLTTMDKRQYERMKGIDSFAAAFPHAIYIEDTSEAEKREILNAEAGRRGMSISSEELERCELANVSIAGMLSALSSAEAELFCGDVGAPRRLTAEKLRFSSNNKPRVSALDELDSLVGLTEVKQKAHEIHDFIMRRGSDALPCLHMVFRGNPGTGKTTVARLFGRILSEAGALRRSDVFVETDREGLVALYVGHTANKTAAKVKEAMGGVLFIDEAYSLGLYDRGNDYGEEAISVLVKRMEDYRRDFVCIMAGYTEEMDRMLDVNPGLRDRVQFYIDFPDYTANELAEIFDLFSKKKDYRLSQAAQETLTRAFSAITANGGKHFSNARAARKLFERVVVQQGLRADDMEIRPVDVELAMGSPDIQSSFNAKSHSRMGFS